MSDYLSERALLWATGTTLGLALLLALHYYYKNLHDYWRRRGVPGPRPWWLVGNMLGLLFNKRYRIAARWREQHGKVYGIYEGAKPALVVSDAEVLHQIGIKDFHMFTNHDTSLMVGELQRNFIFLLHDERWRQARAILSPTFTSGKMRRMYKLMEVCADDLLCSFEEQFDADQRDASHLAPAETVVLIKDLYGLFTMDAIASCCYGIKLDRQRSSSIAAAAGRNEFVRLALKLFHVSIWRLLVSMSVSKWLLQQLGFQMLPDSNIQPFVDRVAQLIERRRTEIAAGRKFDDYLQILLDASASSGSKSAIDTSDPLEAAEAHHSGNDGQNDEDNEGRPPSTDQQKQQQQPMMDQMGVLSSATFLLAVGLETTATLLTHVTYALAHHAQIQARLYDELRTIAHKDEIEQTETSYHFDYETLTSCEYLDSVLSETLRVLSPAVATDRVAKCDYHIAKYNITISAGTKVLLLLSETMNDPDYWPQPQRFDPERFMGQNRARIVPGTYVPFGIGPRHCLGMRFSLTEAKLALARLIMRYEFKPAPNTSWPPKYKVNFGFTALANPRVRVTHRWP